MKRYHVTVSGRVQGVFFRGRTKSMADTLGLKGWVRNMADGTVEAVFEGEEGALKSMLEWCRKGPSLARVMAVDVQEESYEGKFLEFIVRY
jgi:acylphosphatase